MTFGRFSEAFDNLRLSESEATDSKSALFFDMIQLLEQM